MSTIKIGNSVFNIIHTPQNLSQSKKSCESQKSEISNLRYLRSKTTYNKILHNATKTKFFEYRVRRDGESENCFTTVNFLSAFPELETETLCDDGRKLPTICYKQANDTSYIESSTVAHLSLSIGEVVLVVLGIFFVGGIVCCLFRSMMYRNSNEFIESQTRQMNTIMEEVTIVG